MILLLLTSALALSFVPLTNDGLPVVTISAVAFDPATKKLTATFTSTPEGTTIDTHTFRTVVYKDLTGGEVLFSATLDKAKLTVEASTAEVVIDMDETLLDLEKVHIDILAKLVAAPNTESSIAAARFPVPFAGKAASVDAVKNTGDPTKVDVAVTFAAGVTADFSTGKFVFAGKEETVTKAGQVYTATVLKTDLLATDKPYGYFKGTNAATSTLPIPLFTATPALTLAHTDATKAEATFTGAPTEANRVWLEVSGTPTALTLTTQKCNIEYSKLVATKIYYTKADGTPSSNKLVITLPAAPAAPTGTTFVEGATTADAPKVKLTFAAAVTNRKLAMDTTPAATPVDVGTAAPEIELSKFVGTAGCYIVLDGTVPKSLPLSLDAATFTQTPAAAADGKVPVTLQITAVGYMAAAPAGVLVYAKDETDKKKGKYYAFVWDATTPSKGAAQVLLSDWTKVTVRNVESYVCPNYATAIPESPVELTTAAIVKTGVAPKVTVTAPTAITAGYKLTVPVKSDKAIHEEQDVDYTIAVYNAVSAGTLIYSEDVKASLDGADGKTAVIELNKPELAGQKALYFDILQTPKGGAAVSVLNPATRITVTFASKTAISSAASGTDSLKFSITLDSALTTPITAKFVFNGVQKDVTAGTGDKVYDVTILLADILAAGSTTGYFLEGEVLLKSTLPISLFTVNPEVALKHTDATKVEATFSNPPASPGKVWLKSGTEAAAELTLADKKCDIPYAKLASAFIYYTSDAAGTALSSNKKDISLPACVAPTVTFVKGATAAAAPVVKLTFAKAVADRKLQMTTTPASDPVALSDIANEVPLDKFVGTAGFYIVLTGTTPKSLPAPLTAAALTLATAAEDEGNIPVTVTITEIGFLAAKPAGIVVRVKGAADYTGGKYYALSWGQTAGTENKGTLNLPLVDWKASRDKDIEGCVSPVYTPTVPASPTKITAEQTLIEKLITTTVAIETAVFTPADLKLKVTIKSAADVSATATGTYRIVGYSAATAGKEVFTKDFTKADLTGANKEVEVVLAMDEKLKDLKTIHIDVLETLPGKAEESMITDARKEVTFAAADGAVTNTATATEVTFTITLDSTLPDLTKVKFVFNGAEKDVTPVTGQTKKFTVVIAPADLLAADSTTGYFKGDALATTTLPISLLALNPTVALKHTDATKVEATITGVPAGNKVWLKSGTDAATELTLASGTCSIDYAKLGAARVYFTDTAGTALTSNKKDISLAAFTAPEYEWVLVTEGEDKTPKVNLKFAAVGTKRNIIIPGTPDVVLPINAKDNTFALADLVKTGAYYILYDATSKVPETLPLVIPAATLVQAKNAEASGKIPVTVTLTAGLLTAVPTGILVLAEGETDLTKGKYSAFTWGTTAATAHIATGEVTVADFKDLTAKNIESYVANKEGTTVTKIAAAEKLIVIPKKEEPTPTPEGGAFGQMVSLMAVLLSLFVFAL